jgi:hypothetical protein
VLQPLRTPSWWRLAVVGAAACATLAVPQTAGAHGTTRVSALDDQARITRVGGFPVVDARVIDGDRRLELTVEQGHTVVVVGDAGEPFLRFTQAGIALNRHAPTALINGLVQRGSVPTLDPRAAAAWVTVSRGRRYAWHDHRLAPRPAVVRDGDVAGWSIPLVVDGRRTAVAGRLWHDSGPALWRWLVGLGAALVSAGFVATRPGRRVLSRTTVVAAAVSSAAALLVRLALVLAPGTSTLAWLGFALSWAVPVGAGLAFVRLREAPYAGTAPGLAAMYAVFVGLGSAGILVHGFVVSSWPVWLVRSFVAAAVAVGFVGIAAAVGDVMRANPAARGTSARRSSSLEPRRARSR